MDPLVSQACVYGDCKSYLEVLLTLDWPAVQQWAEQRHIPYADMYELTGSVALRTHLDEHVAEVNAHLARFEQVKCYAVLADDFTVDNGLLTPTDKLRRNAVNAPIARSSRHCIECQSRPSPEVHRLKYIDCKGPLHGKPGRSH